MSAVTIAMLITVNYSTKVLDKVGRYPLTKKERQILIDAGYRQDIENINREIKDLFNE